MLNQDKENTCRHGRPIEICSGCPVSPGKNQDKVREEILAKFATSNEEFDFLNKLLDSYAESIQAEVRGELATWVRDDITFTPYSFGGDGEKGWQWHATSILRGISKLLPRCSDFTPRNKRADEEECFKCGWLKKHHEAENGGVWPLLSPHPETTRKE